MAPVFSKVIMSGMKVEFIIRNRKGDVRLMGNAIVRRNDGAGLWVESYQHDNTYYIAARDVYSGKTNLKILEEEQ